LAAKTRRKGSFSGETMVSREFYELRGWDPDTGFQRAATLRDLMLDDIGDDMDRLGLVKRE
jgi:hypothetical protein